MKIKYSYIAILAGGLVVGPSRSMDSLTYSPAKPKKPGVANMTRTPAMRASWLFRKY
jgi:hypothetical protein